MCLMKLNPPMTMLLKKAVISINLHIIPARMYRSLSKIEGRDVYFIIHGNVNQCKITLKRLFSI
jgi:hypothetical protein